MTTAWLHAGVRCVIASAAAVNDAVAHDVLVAVHRARLGRGPGGGLAAACPPVSDAPSGSVRLLLLTLAEPAAIRREWPEPASRSRIPCVAARLLYVDTSR